MIYFNLFLLMLTGASGFFNSNSGNPMEPIDGPIVLKPLNENYSYVNKCNDDIGPEDCVLTDS